MKLNNDLNFLNLKAKELREEIRTRMKQLGEELLQITIKFCCNR